MSGAADPPLSLLDLPSDIFSIVAGHLEADESQGDHLYQNLAALRCVCRQLRQAVNAAATIIRVHPGVDAAELASLTRQCTGAREVQLRDLAADTAPGVLDALAALPGLRALDMPMFPDMQLEDWTRLGGLTSLALRRCSEAHQGTLVAVLPRVTRLRSLTLASADMLPLAAADVQHFSALTGLTHLDLGAADGVAELAPHLPALRSLVLQLDDFAL